jgi:hypothetical protein
MAKKKKKAKGQKIFNDRPRKIFRHYIGRSEFLFSSIFTVFVVLMGIWFFAQKENYDPGERDIAYELLLEQSVEDHLWEPPMQYWTEPGTSVASAAVGPDVGIYPAEVASDGWAPIGRLKEFTNKTVYEKIDGQEVQYNSFGMQFMYFLSIGKGDIEVNIELYDMGEFKNALGVYSAQRSDGSEVEQIGTAFITRTSVGALAIVNQFYFKFSANIEDSAISDHAVKVIDAFAKQQGEGDPDPAIYTMLNDGLGLDFKQIAYQKTDVFQYDFAADFWFATPSGDSKLKYFLHQELDDESADSLFGSIMEEHEFEFDVVSQDDSDVLMRHDFLKTFNTMNKTGSFVYGVEGAATQEEAEAAAQKLKTLISGADIQ